MTDAKSQKFNKEALLPLLLAMLSMLGPFAIDTYFPTFDAIAGEFHVTLKDVQLTLSTYLGAFAVTSLFLGPLSDSFGRRVIVLSTLAIFAIASCAAIYVQNLEQLIIIRAIQGAVGSSGMVLGQAIVRDKYDGAMAQKTISTIVLIFGLAPAIAPILGGYLHVHFGWRSIFVFLVAFTILVIAMSYFFLDETLPIAKRHDFHAMQILRNYIGIFRTPEFIIRSMAQAMAFGGTALYISSAPAFILNILHLKETDFGWLFVPLVAGMMLGSIFANILAGKIKPQSNILLGFAIMAFAAIFNLFYNHSFVPKVPFAILPIFFYTFGYSIAMPAITIKTLDLVPHVRGTASAVSNFIRMVFFTVFSGIVAPMVFHSAKVMALAMLIIFIIMCLLWYSADRIAAKKSP